MSKWLYIVRTNCKDPDREPEFNDWYNKIHIPDILASTPAFTRATRYESHGMFETPSKYLAIYEIESNDIEQTMMAHRENVDRLRAQGRMADLTNLVAREMYIQKAT